MKILEVRGKPLFLHMSHWFTCVDGDSIQQSKKQTFYIQVDFFI